MAAKRTNGSSHLGCPGASHENGSAGNRGQSLVEFALIAPILMLIFLGIIDFSRLYYGNIAASNAARVGAVMAMNPLKTESDVLTAVQTEAGSTVTFTSVAVSPTVRYPGNLVEVRVTYVFSPFTPLVASFWGGGPLSRDSVARERVY